MPALTSSVSTTVEPVTASQVNVFYDLVLDFGEYVGLGFTEPDTGVFPRSYYSRSPADLAPAYFVENALGEGWGARARRANIQTGTQTPVVHRALWRGSEIVDVFGSPTFRSGYSYLRITFEGYLEYFGGDKVGLPFALPADAITTLAVFFDPAPTHIVFTVSSETFAFVRNELPTAAWNRWQPYPYRVTADPSSDAPLLYPCPLVPRQIGAIPGRSMWKDGLELFAVGSDLHVSSGINQPASSFGRFSLAWGVPATLLCGHASAELDDANVTDFGLAAEYFDVFGNSIGTEASIAEWAKVTGSPTAAYMTVMSADRAVTMTPPANARWVNVTSYRVHAILGIQPTEDMVIHGPVRPTQLSAPYRNPLDGTAICGQVHTGED